MLQLKPINECCEQNPVTTGFAHSNGKPAATSTTTNINVRFAPVLPVEVGIRRLTKYSNTKSTVDTRPPMTVTLLPTTTNGEP